MKIALKVRFVIFFILLLQIISYSAIAQSKKEQISILNYQLDSLKQNVQIGQIKTREFEAQLISVNKNLNELLRELMITKKSLAKEDSLMVIFENELKNITKKLLLSEEKSLQMNNALSSYKVEIDDLKNELTKRDSLISIYEKKSLLDKDSILLLNLAKPDIDKTKANKKNIDLTARLNSNTKYKNVIGKPIKIGNLEIAQYDFPSSLDWSQLFQACASIGDGWRLPSPDELTFLFQNRVAIGMTQSSYWSSAPASNSPLKLGDGSLLYWGWRMIIGRGSFLWMEELPNISVGDPLPASSIEYIYARAVRTK